MSIFKKFGSVLAAILCLCMLLSMTAFAADITAAGGSGEAPVVLTAGSDSDGDGEIDTPLKFMVTVPTSLPVHVDADGNVTVATDAKIVNNSAGAVKVTNVAMEGANGWAIKADASFDPASAKVNAKVNAKEFSMTLNSEATVEDGISFSAANWTRLDGANATDSDELPLSYTAKVAPQGSVVTDATMANVVFTLGWDSVA